MAAQALSHGERRGIDFDIGAKLPFLFLEAGLTDIQTHSWQSAYLSGAEKHFWTRTIGEATPGIVSMDLATQEKMDIKFAQMHAINQDPSILLMLPRQWQVSGTF